MPSLEGDVSEEMSVEENEEDRKMEVSESPPEQDSDIKDIHAYNGYTNIRKTEDDSASDHEDGKFCVDEEEEKEEEVDEEDKDLPIDRGWAWVVLAGSVLNIAIMIGYIRGLSILFIEYLRVFNASAAKTTLLIGVNAAVYSVTALISMHILVGRFGVRKTTFLGATLSVVGMACAIAPINIDFLIGTHSTILGIGHAMIYGPSVVQVGIYFNKRRGLASAVSMSGVSLGGMIFPPMIRYFLDEYGLQGTMILLTGITMNMYVGASVFWPIESFRKKSEKTEKGLLLNNGSEYKQSDRILESPSIQITSETSSNTILQSDIDVHPESPCVPRRRLRIESTGSNLSRTSKNVLFYASQPDLGSVLSIHEAKVIEIGDIQPIEENQNRKSCQCFKNVFSALDFSLFKRPMFIFVICYSFFCVTCSLPVSYLPALSSEKGISKQDAALFLTVMGALDFICRLLVGLLVDTRLIPVNMLMAIGLMVNGAFSLFTYFYNSYETLLMFSCVNGISICTYFGVTPVAIIEFLGLKYLAKTIGFVSLFHGMSVAIANPLIGIIRDATGSYIGGYHYIGVCTNIGAILLLCEPLVRRFANRDRKNTDELDIESKPLNGV